MLKQTNNALEGNLLDVIPGYRDAVEKEQWTREAAYNGAIENICGVDVLPMTPRHFVILDSANCAFLRGGTITEIDIARFLWVLSPTFRPVKNVLDLWRQQRFLRSIRKLDFVTTRDRIIEYLEETFQDAPGTKSGKWSIPYWSFCASLIDFFASEYGWTDAHVMSMPLKRIYDLQKRISSRRNPDAIQFNRSDAVRSNWLREINQKSETN